MGKKKLKKLTKRSKLNRERKKEMKPKEKILKLAEIFMYILNLLGGEEYSKTKLIKLLYLLDYETFKSTGHIFTDLSYKKYYYGPYSEEIEEAISLLKDKGILEVTVTQGIYGQKYYIFKLKRYEDIERLSKKERKEIQKKLENYLNKNLDEILDIVYETEPVKKARFGERIYFC